MSNTIDQIVVSLATLMAAVLIILLALFGRSAQGGPMMDCLSEPLGADWHYRTNVGGRSDRCWYQGPSMKPRWELRWPPPDKVSEAAQPEGEKGVAFEAVPVRAQSEFEDRWSGLYDHARISNDPIPMERWK